MMRKFLEWVSKFLHSEEIGIDGRLYMTRYFLWPRAKSKARGGWFLHHIHLPDTDRRLHNHPWDWAWGMPLVGWYVEQRLMRAAERGGITHFWTRNRFRFNRLSGLDFHRITTVSPGGVWTLFRHGPYVQPWGFLKQDPTVDVYGK